MLVCGARAGSECQDLVVNAVGEAVEHYAGSALEPTFGGSGWWKRAEDLGESGSREQAVADGVSRFAALANGGWPCP